MPLTTDNLVIPFVVYDTGGEPEAGLTVGSFTLTLTNPSGSAVTGLAVTEVGGGWYKAAKAATTWTTAGLYTFKAAYTGMQDANVLIEVETPAASDAPTVEEIVDGIEAAGISITVVSPFDATTERITIGYGEDYTSGSTNGVLALTTTASIDLTAGGTVYFAVRPKNTPATSAATFTITGTATAALAYTVSLTNANTRALQPGTYLWTSWHVSVGALRTELGHGDYVVSDLVQPTV